MCNRFIKFGKFYEWATAHGANYIATGHYARVRKIPNKSQIPNSKKLQTANCKLLAGLDSSKDQSYFLWQIGKEQLPRILFPVGGIKKTAVRKLAKKFGLVTAEKKDSQGLCFIGKVDMKEFLSHYIKEKPGNILDEKGRVIGKHDGAFFYTIGQRLGFIVTRTNPSSRASYSERLGRSRKLTTGQSAEGEARIRAEGKAQYVIAKNVEKNTITVFAKSERGELNGGVTRVRLTGCNWFQKPVPGKKYAARIRYREPLQSVKIIGVSLKRAAATAFFAKPCLAAPGQSLVFYDGDEVVGGGIIK
jgi:tRNA-specific 2-thiouridylase